jgi:triacylglycerol lipase
MSHHPCRLQYPLVLIHGLGAKSRFGVVEYFYGLPKYFESQGTRVLVVDLPSWHSLERRSEDLRLQIEAAFPGERVNLLGHSMGGLDARALAADPLFGERVASVTTLGTPHRGTYVGDAIHEKLSPPVKFALEKLLNQMGLSNQGFEQITSEGARLFTEAAPNQKHTAYYSAMTVIQAPAFKNALPTFWFAHDFLHKKEGDNDGFVSLESSKWGEFIAFDYADHYAQIGHILGRTGSFNHFRFFDKILHRLNKDGF